MKNKYTKTLITMVLKTMTISLMFKALFIHIGDEFYSLKDLASEQGKNPSIKLYTTALSCLCPVLSFVFQRQTVNIPILVIFTFRVCNWFLLMEGWNKNKLKAKSKVVWRNIIWINLELSFKANLGKIWDKLCLIHCC